MILQFNQIFKNLIKKWCSYQSLSWIKMKIYIETLTDECIELDVEDTYSLFAVKQKLKGKKGWEKIDIGRFAFNGFILDDKMTLKQYNIVNQNIIYLISS